MDGPERPIILFDGVCHLCNGFVQFVLRRDQRGQFDFAPLQSAFARERLRTLHLDSIALVEQGQVIFAENAVIRVLSGLKQPWPLLARIGELLPGRFLAWNYRTIARYRYGLFGKGEVCALPLPQWKGRFLS